MGCPRGGPEALELEIDEDEEAQSDDEEENNSDDDGLVNSVINIRAAVETSMLISFPVP